MSSLAPRNTQTTELSDKAINLGRSLMNVLGSRANRKVFFSTLSRLLQQHFTFDRLCINLYDQQGEMLTYFTAAEGTIVSSLSPVRPAEPSSTVAGHVISTRKPVIITDFAQYFSESTIHPIAEAGLKATMAFPLILDNEIIATLHCSFAEKPDNVYEITSFLLELCPVIATCLGAILSLEQVRYNESRLAAPALAADAAEDDIIRHSQAMRAVMARVKAVAPLDIPVLLLGETGTGKSLFAQEIHRRSRRKDARLVKVNCPSLPQTLFESELFGHAKGAFTGAAGKRIGRFELAHGGTLFLDEIAELSLEMQSKLLQVLDDSSFERVGESVPLAVDVRIVAATNVRPGDAIRSGTLRSDLYYRLAPCVIELPPLRERLEDIPLLAASLAAKTATKLGLPVPKLSRPLVGRLLDYSWPGNVRELRNIVSSMVIQNSMPEGVSEVWLAEHLEANARALYAPPPADGALAEPDFPPSDPNAQPHGAAGAHDLSLMQAERSHIEEVLRLTGGVIAGPNGAAAKLGIPHSTLQHRLKKLGISA